MLRALGAGIDLKEFDCDNKWGLNALKRIFTDLSNMTSAMPGVKVNLKFKSNGYLAYPQTCPHDALWYAFGQEH